MEVTCCKCSPGLCFFLKGLDNFWLSWVWTCPRCETGTWWVHEVTMGHSCAGLQWGHCHSWALVTDNEAGGDSGFSPCPKTTSQGGDTRFWGLWWNKGWMCCPSQGEEQKLNFMNLNKRLISVRREGRDREELQTISTLQALTESLMRDNIQLGRRMGNLGNACIYSSKLLMAPPYSPPQLWWLSKQERNVQMKYSSWKY